MHQGHAVGQTHQQRRQQLPEGLTPHAREIKGQVIRELGGIAVAPAGQGEEQGHQGQQQQGQAIPKPEALTPGGPAHQGREQHLGEEQHRHPQGSCGDLIDPEGSNGRERRDRRDRRQDVERRHQTGQLCRGPGLWPVNNPLSSPGERRQSKPQ